MAKKLYCFNCNKDVIPIVSKQDNLYVVHNQKIKVKEKVFTCPFCNNEILEDLNNSLYNIYNEYLKLFDLSFTELKKIRKSYNLTQELFAKALNWSKRSVIRYENAESLPQKQNIAIYNKIKNNKTEFLNILKSNRNLIDKDTYFKIYDSINAEIDIKTTNLFLYILKNNNLTITELMKYLFAIDFQFFKEYQKAITNLTYVHADYGPIIDNRNNIINILIKQNYIEILNNKDDYVVFNPIQESDLSFFSNEELTIINKVLTKLKGKNAKSLTNWSHEFKGWIETKSGKVIKYSYAKDFELPN